MVDKRKGKKEGRGGVLNARQYRFAMEYLIDLNGTQAAIRAGYSPRTAGQIAGKLLKKVEIQTIIQKLMADREDRTEITQDRVLNEIAKMAFASMADFIEVQSDGSAVVSLLDLSRDQLTALSDITVEEYVEGRGENAREVKKVRIKLGGKRESLELLGKHLKLWTDRVEIDDLRNANDSDLVARLAGLEHRAAAGKVS